MICWSRDEESVGGVGMKLEVTSDSHGVGLALAFWIVGGEAINQSLLLFFFVFYSFFFSFPTVTATDWNEQQWLGITSVQFARQLSLVLNMSLDICAPVRPQRY
jgi:hypothetical protein